MTEPDFWKTYFSGRKCRNYAGKTGFLAFFRDFIISFFWFFAQRCVLAMPKTWPSSIFQENFFPTENAGNRLFCRVWSYFFLIFRCFFHTKTFFITMPTIKHDLRNVSILKNYTSLEINAGNMLEIAVFTDFHWTFSLHFVVLSHKSVVNNNSHNQAWFNCQ